MFSTQESWHAYKWNILIKLVACVLEIITMTLLLAFDFGPETALSSTTEKEAEVVPTSGRLYALVDRSDRMLCLMVNGAWLLLTPLLLFAYLVDDMAGKIPVQEITSDVGGAVLLTFASTCAISAYSEAEATPQKYAANSYAGLNIVLAIVLLVDAFIVFFKPSASEEANNEDESKEGKLEANQHV